ncbi:MAG TPA: cupin domain-containing protein [Bryobacteraceae bacterium]|jgi:quercetin dioxygenase-like cupin family protein|nr:cupin domain-containing protein [Bryobacteraceae bacterium]
MPKRRDFLKTAAVAALFEQASNAANPKLKNTVVSSKQATASKENGQDLKVYFDGPTDQLKSMTTGNLLLMPGKSPHPPHQHPEEELIMVTEGSGEITVEGKPYPVSAGSIMYCAGNKLHGITNTGTKPMLFYFCKWQA